MQAQYKSKVFDLAASEEKIMRLTADKTKADNKYFAAMRSKEAADGEIRALRSTLERSTEAGSAHRAAGEAAKSAKVRSGTFVVIR